MDNELVRTLLLSLIPIVITALFGWIGSRDAESKRKHAVEDARQRIELINSYVATQKLVTDDAAELAAVKKKAADELYEIKSFLDNDLDSLEGSSEKKATYWRRFFLLYGMHTWRAKVFRVAFFLTVALSMSLTAIVSGSSFSASSLEEFGLWFNLFMVFIFAAPGILVALLFRWLAVKLDKPGRVAAGVAPVS